MKYAVNYLQTDSGYQATFPDFPNLTATAETLDGISDEAYDALIGKLMSYMENGLEVPAPKAIPDPAYVPLAACVPPKILLHNLIVSQNKTRSWVAAQMGVSRQMMTRLFNLRESTKVETVQSALDTLGHDLVFTIEPKSRNTVI
ncbi:type II toxin-antitoxin system HicB family antitoxin [Salmonella enterica subsp. enterica serovar Saintpaul]|nr:type II toxin-antitoxin system HicB family antitoxin [Salmonella enterica subsp. enterica serovar Saintpaul]